MGIVKRFLIATFISANCLVPICAEDNPIAEEEYFELDIYEVSKLLNDMDDDLKKDQEFIAIEGGSVNIYDGKFVPEDAEQAEEFELAQENLVPLP